MKLILVRHGETEENKRREIQGHKHGKLSSLGIAQAKKVAKRLKDEKIDYIFSSDLARASNTAKEIHKFHPKTPIKFVKELREWSMGEFEGKTAPPDWKEIRWKLNTFKESGGERLDEILERAKCFLLKILNKFHGKTVLFTAHAGIIRAIITAIFEESWEHMEKTERQGNTGITIFEFDENKKPSLKLMSCTKHLE